MNEVTRILDTRIQIRNDSAEQWTYINPILMKGEIGIEADTNLFKFGDGITPWIDLPYVNTQVIIMNVPPAATDWNYLVGTIAIVNGERVFILVSTGPDDATWKELVTMESIQQLGYGDMLQSIFATNPQSAQGYVDKAITANRLAQPRNFSMTGQVIAPVVAFDGTSAVVFQTALEEIAALAGGGTFIKVQVDRHGRVVGHEALLASDIPNLTLNHITDAGTAAGKNTGTAIGQIVVVGPDGKIDPSILPEFRINQVFVVDDLEDKLELDAQTGDIVIVTNAQKTFILAGDDPEEEDHWKNFMFPFDGVKTVNGKAGPHVTLTTDDVEEGDDNLYFTEDRFNDHFEKQYSRNLQDGSTIVHDTDMLILNGGQAKGHVRP